MNIMGDMSMMQDLQILSLDNKSRVVYHKTSSSVANLILVLCLADAKDQYLACPDSLLKLN